VAVIGLIIGIYSIANAPANILFGKIIDRLGAKLPLTFGLLGDALAIFLYSLCRVPFNLILVRLFHGISGGVIGPATMSISAAHTKDNRKGKTMAFYGMSLAAATLVGYLVSATLASKMSYDFVFYVGALMLVSGAVAAMLIPARRRRPLAPSESFKVELGRIAELMKRKGLRSSYSSVFAQYFAFGGLVTLLPLYLRSLGMDTFHVGIMLATFAGTFIALQVPSGMLSDKIGRKIPAVIGLCLCVVSLVILPTQESFPTLISVMVLYGTSYALIFPSIAAMVADYSTPQERGRATGIFHALLTAGVAIGAPLMGWTAEAIGIRSGLVLCSSAAILAIPIVLLSSPGSNTDPRL
jgi:MFS family permease